jgi:hypothetical protein
MAPDLGRLHALAARLVSHPAHIPRAMLVLLEAFMMLG